jgi:CheY-like chemotaxis protein
MARYRILVVDDYPSTAQVTCTLLTMLGHECRAVDSGRKALEEARVFEPDVAILDIGLPDLSGYELVRELRRLLPSKPLYVAAMTGWGQPQDRAQAFAAGFDHHLLKPADATKLKDVLRRVDLARASAGVPDPA